MIQKDKHKAICRLRREREKNQRIQSILAAAGKVFSAKGYLKATMDEIAMAAQITKPTIYLYFKTKDDLLLTLIQPLTDNIHSRLEIVKERLLSGKIKDGGILIKSIFCAVNREYESSPETFRIIQLYQQQNLFCDLKPEIRSALNDRGRIGFNLIRNLLTKGMEMGLIKKMNPFAMADVIWGSMVGVIQLEDSKADERKGHRLKKSTLGLACRLIVEALTRDCKMIGH